MNGPGWHPPSDPHFPRRSPLLGPRVSAPVFTGSPSAHPCRPRPFLSHLPSQAPPRFPWSIPGPGADARTPAKKIARGGDLSKL